MTPQHLPGPARLAGSPLLATQRDQRLVELFRAGSEPAFEAIVSRYRGPLLRYCSALLGRERAEDAVQQALVNAYNAMRRDESELNLKPWLYRIAHNAALNLLRDRALGHDELADDLAGAERPEHALERRERLQAVMAAVRDLPERQRDAIVLRELEGRSYEEIALALGVGGGAVRQLLNRARNTLRTAATAVTPAGLLLKIPPGGLQAGEPAAARVAELTAGAGAGALVTKVATTALVTGAVVGGIAVEPPGGDSDEPRRPAAAPPPARGASPATGELDEGGSPTSVRRVEGRDRGDRRGGDDDEDRGGPSENSGPGNAEDAADHSGSSGSGSSGSGSGSSGSGSGSSGSGSGSSGSGSGSSGSGSSGSGSSGSGLSGSDSDGSGSSGSG